MSAKVATSKKRAGLRQAKGSVELCKGQHRCLQAKGGILGKGRLAKFRVKLGNGGCLVG